MPKIRESYSPEQKVKIVKEYLVKRRGISDSYEKYDFRPNMYYCWQKQFFENGEHAFMNKKYFITGFLENELSKLERN